MNNIYIWKNGEMPKGHKKTIDFEKINDLKESLKGGSDSLKKKKVSKNLCEQ